LYYLINVWVWVHHI